ncbi:putative ATP-dependent zinc metalloprotease FtsH [Melanomma pulvis-pyrius CBS 109.77]|uniref:Putative ATP-dependent zinc metalloprotease FtsH n=1 Tax=Melanomma pulvis-pyrius CBS 109.77 TaxID=1314802 RepID=A0A6A6X8H8_9PLEO|nr:putative ATP-dependent zinc metalloprotease FtsH [Melanomma pulvis-pyrius CBS 109.77]
MTSIFSNALERAGNDGVVAPGSRATIHHVYMNPTTKKWATQYPEELGAPIEDAESAQHAVIARYKSSLKPDKHIDLHSIVVQSEPLRKILTRVLDGYPGITLELDRLEFEAPFACFVHRWAKIEALRQEFVEREESEESEIALAHLKLLYKILQEELGSVLHKTQDLIKHGVISYDLIWTIFEPGSLIYTKKAGHDRVYKLKTADFGSGNQRGKYGLQVEHVDFDGEKFGMATGTLVLTRFPGTKKITKLESYPLRYYKDLPELKQRLIQRGRKFEAFRSFHFVAYEGVATAPEKKKVYAKYTINDRVIIDAASFARYKTKVDLQDFDITVDADDSASLESDEEESEEDCVILDTLAAKAPIREAGKMPVIREGSKSSLTEEQLILAISIVRGYSPKDKQWLRFDIDNVKDIVWDEAAFKSLVAPQEQKDLILAFAESQAKNRGHFDDFIQGKGKGIIMLLCGPPGVGKTLTAESVAEAMTVPLISIGATDLGSKPLELEKSLNNILEMCSKWNAVLLLDEADVYLEARSTTDLDRNKLISIFLRQLEYFQGIMFLTTNRVDNMDAAFESRIHLTLNYNELDKASRRQVWSTFLDRCYEMRDSSVGKFTDAEVDRLAKVQLNGRQIKNVLKTAQLLASKYDECLGIGHLETVLKLRKANEKRG